MDKIIDIFNIICIKLNIKKFCPKCCVEMNKIKIKTSDGKDLKGWQCPICKSFLTKMK